MLVFNCFFHSLWYPTYDGTSLPIIPSLNFCSADFFSFSSFLSPPYLKSTSGNLITVSQTNNYIKLIILNSLDYDLLGLERLYDLPLVGLWLWLWRRRFLRFGLHRLLGRGDGGLALVNLDSINRLADT